METSWLLPAIIALAPGAYAWWTGRALATRADDPELPDLLLAHKNRQSLPWLLSLIALMLVPGGGMEWIPLLLLGIGIGGFPLRRKVYDEQWGLGAYLLWSTGIILAAAGVFLFLQFTPLLVILARPYHLAVAAAALAVIQLWRRYQIPFWLLMCRARPLADPALQARFDEIVQRAGGVVPRVYRIGPRGGRVANAVALPDQRTPSVAFGDDLLELLDADETTAIFAHELAHLEHHDAKRLRSLRMRMHLLVAWAVGSPLALIAMGWGNTLAALVAGILSVMALLMGTARQRQADETAADLRAAELVGDPETVVRALVRLHQYARLPRRWPHEMEAGASHPSLARRIAALRGDAAVPAAAPGVVRSPREGSWVAFDQRRISWFDGVPAGTPPEPAALHQAAAAARTVSYAELADLRVRMEDGARPVLHATDRTGISWSFPIFAEDVETVRERVDQVDAQFAAPAPVPSVAPRRWVAALALAAAWFGGAWALVIPILVALVWPATTALAAVGAMALGLAGVRAADGALRWTPAFQLGLLGVLVVAGVAALAMSFARGERRGSPRRPGVPLVLLGVLAALMLWRLATAWKGGVDWRGGEPTAVTAGLLLLGLAAGLFRLPASSARRIGAAAVGVLGIAVLLLSLGTDRLGGRLPRIRWTQGTAVAAGPSVALPRLAELVAMSPSGRAWLVRHPAATGAWTGEAGWRYVVGDFSGFQRDFPAVDAAFAADGHLLVAQGGGDSVEVRMEPVAGGAPLWRHTLRGVVRPELAARGGDRWSVLAHQPDGLGRVMVSGAGAGPLRTDRARLETPFSPSFGVRGGMVMLRPASRADAGGALPWPLGMSVDLGWEVWRLDAAGEYPLGRVKGFPQCAGDPRGGGVCEAVQDGRATLWAFGRGGGMRRVGEIPPDLYELTLRDGVIASVRAGDVAVIRPDERRAWRLRLPGQDAASAAYPVPGGVAVVHGAFGSTKLSIFRAPAAGR